VDESGSDKAGFRPYARALRGKRIGGLVAGKRAKRVNVVAGFCDGKILGEFCYTGKMNSELFEDWFCNHLLPLTRKGDVIVMDNASYHKKKHLLMFAWVCKIKIIFLPTYSPDLNPIEKVWGNLKRFLRDYGQHFINIEHAIYWYFDVAFS